ncbi:MAG TPA: GNAT family N-acetyltransferase [Gemmatimonadales bacterium]|nr:GNAT family N-acetyltransferase [Gemmatimonadales bacterium]
MSCSLRPLGRAHRAPLEALVRGSGFFREAEVGTAVELLDESLAGDTDYRFIGGFAGEQFLGFACWGPNPDTQGTYDLYWIVVDRNRQGTGIGSQLLAHAEQAIASEHGRLIVVETSGRPDYAPTRAFYEARGYSRAATIHGYYAPGDDLAIYVKDLT